MYCVPLCASIIMLHNYINYLSYHFLLFQFSDILLHTEPVGPSAYKFKNELPLCAVKMELPKVSLVPHSFELFSTNRSFILSAK